MKSFNSITLMKKDSKDEKNYLSNSKIKIKEKESTYFELIILSLTRTVFSSSNSLFEFILRFIKYTINDVSLIK